MDIGTRSAMAGPRGVLHHFYLVSGIPNLIRKSSYFSSFLPEHIDGSDFSIIMTNEATDIWLILASLFSIVFSGLDSFLLLTLHSVKGS